MPLTERAAEKLAALTDAETEARDLVHAVMSRISDMSRSLATASAAQAANVEYELTRQRARLSEVQAKHVAIAGGTAPLRDWVNRLGNRDVEDVKPPKIKLKAGETYLDLLAATRLSIKALLAERSRVESCALPKAELRAAAAAWVNDRSRKGMPVIRAGHGVPFEVSFSATTFDHKLTLVDHLCWLDPVKMVQRLEEEIAIMPEPALAMTTERRNAELASQNSKLIDLEHLEQACIEAALAAGIFVARRPNASPEAVLGIKIVKRQTAAA